MANVHIFDISRSNIQVSQLFLANMYINISQCDCEIHEPQLNDKLLKSSKEKGSAGLSRRRFILQALSMGVASDVVFSHKLLSTNMAESYSGDTAADAALTIIDTHTHFFDPTRKIPVGRDRSVPWPSPKESGLYKPTLPPDWEVLAKPLGMKGTVVVEAGTSWLEDNDWILMLADRYHSIVGFIGNLSGTAIGQGVAIPVWADMTRFRQEVNRLARNPIFRGIRVGGLSISNDLSGGHYPHFEVLADSGLVIDVNGSTAAEIVALAKAVPSLTIVVDHMFGFDPVSASSEKWRSDITVMGDVQNIIMKVSGLVEGLDSPQTDPSNALAQCSGVLDHVYQSFGPDRLVFGTNWPVSQPKGDISVVTNIVRSYFGPKGKEVLAKVFAGNARRVYRYVDR